MRLDLSLPIENRPMRDGDLDQRPVAGPVLNFSNRRVSEPEPQLA